MKKISPKRTISSPLLSVQGLHRAGLITHVTNELENVAAQFSVSITPAIQALIDPRDAADPIAAQFVPHENELKIKFNELSDPIGDQAHSPLKGIIHRYPDRVLLNLLDICPVYCRYCFRRESLNQSNGMLSSAARESAYSYIADRKEIWEVILSGGDPLMLSDRRLKEVITRLNAIKHVKVIRFHTRVPVVNPQRVTKQLLAALRSNAPVYMLLHCNHARELSNAARTACALLVNAGIPMLSQSVLLRGVNDTAETLRDLMRALVECRVKPHYLHHLDHARGIAHFRVPLKEAQALVRGLRGHLSGLCQPNLMLDIPGGAGKIPVGPVFAEGSHKEWKLVDFKGKKHTYRDN